MNISAIKGILEQYRRSTLQLILCGVSTVDGTGLAMDPAASRVGGPALVSAGYPWPVDSRQTPMMHLAQLNLADCDMPEPYPTSGVLQFYISTDDSWSEALGRYIPVSEFSECSHQWILPDDPDDSVIHGGFFTVTTKPYQQLPTMDDRDFDFLPFPSDMDPDFFYEDHAEELVNVLNDQPTLICGGGWATFRQWDPRPENESLELLLQLDCYEDNGVVLNYGDRGIVNFFVNPHDVEKEDFSHVFYTWSQF